MQGAPYAEDYSKVPCGCSHTDTEADMCPGDFKHQLDTEIDDEFWKVKKRFPTLTHMSDAGIITENERKIIEDIDLKCIQVWIMSQA